MAMVFIVTAEHWNTPGRHVNAYTTLDAARAQAVLELNALLDDADREPIDGWEQFESALETLQDIKGAEYTYVEIDEVTLHGTTTRETF